MKIYISIAAWLLAWGHVFGQGCQDLFISEYVEGWSNNKALEIYNPTNEAIDLSDYRLERYPNGEILTDEFFQVSLQGTIAPHDVVVAVLDKQNPDGVGFEAPVWDELAERADLWLCPVYEENAMMYYNGNDAIVLRKISTNEVLDIFGKIGEDPGQEGWAQMTTNHTLIRKFAVEGGDTNPVDDFLVVDEWEGMLWADDSLNYTLDQVFSNLGFHDCVCGSLEIAGCLDDMACNFNPGATEDDGSCDYSCYGCTDSEALNWDETATMDDGSCSYFETSCAFIGSEEWADLGAGFFAEVEVLTHEFGVVGDGALVLSLPEVMEEPATGNAFAVMAWNDLVVSGLPDGFVMSNAPTSMAPGTQVCLTYSGTPVEEGMFDVLVSGELVLSVFGQPYSVGSYSSSVPMLITPNVSGIVGCTYPNATNYLSYATIESGTCSFEGCMDPEANNFQIFALSDDGSCEYGPCTLACPSDVDGDGSVGTGDLLSLLASFGLVCE